MRQTSAPEIIQIRREDYGHDADLGQRQKVRLCIKPLRPKSPLLPIGKYRLGGQGRLQSFGRIVHAERTARDTAIVDAVLKVANGTGKTPTEIALAWVLDHQSLLTSQSRLSGLNAQVKLEKKNHAR